MVRIQTARYRSRCFELTLGNQLQHSAVFSALQEPRLSLADVVQIFIKILKILRELVPRQHGDIEVCGLAAAFSLQIMFQILDNLGKMLFPQHDAVECAAGFATVDLERSCEVSPQHDPHVVHGAVSAVAWMHVPRQCI